MPASAHTHQVLSTPWRVFHCKQKYFREYFHWNEVGFGRGQQRTSPEPLWLVTPVERSGQNLFTGSVLPIQRIGTTNPKDRYCQFKGSVLPFQRIGTTNSKDRYYQFKRSVLPLQRIGTPTSKDWYPQFKGLVLPLQRIGTTTSKEWYYQFKGAVLPF